METTFDIVALDFDFPTGRLSMDKFENLVYYSKRGFKTTVAVSLISPVKMEDNITRDLYPEDINENFIDGYNTLLDITEGLLTPTIALLYVNHDSELLCTIAHIILKYGYNSVRFRGYVPYPQN